MRLTLLVNGLLLKAIFSNKISKEKKRILGIFLNPGRLAIG
jgi:hypothetical protein